MKRRIRLSSWSTDVNKLHEKTRRSTIRESILSWSILTSLQNFCAKISTAEKILVKTNEDKTFTRIKLTKKIVKNLFTIFFLQSKDYKKSKLPKKIVKTKVDEKTYIFTDYFLKELK